MPEQEERGETPADVLVAALREALGAPEGRISKYGRGGAYSAAMLVLAWHMAAQLGYVRPAAQPTEVVNRPATEIALERYATQNHEAILATEKLVTDASNLIAELYAGSAPRDYRNVPLWHGLNERLDRLTEALKKNADASYRLTGALEGVEPWRIPLRPKEAKQSKAEPEDQTWLRRFLGWLGGDVG